MALLVNSLYVFGLLAASIFLIAVIRQKSTEEQKYLLGLAFFIALAMFGYMLQYTSKSYDEAIISMKIIYTGITHVNIFMLLFFFRNCNIKPPPVLMPFLCLADCAINVAAMMMGKNELFFKDIRYRTIDQLDLNMIVYESGPFHIAFLGVSIVYILICAIVMYFGVKRDKTKFAGLGGMLLAMLIPVALTNLYSTEFISIDLTPLGYVFTELLVFGIVTGSTLYDVRDTAREYIMESLDDAIVIVDSASRLTWFNNKAAELYPELKFKGVGYFIDTISMEITNLIKAPKDEVLKDVELGPKTFRPEVIRLTKSNGKIKSFVLVLTDVTKQVEKEELQSEFNRALERSVEAKTKQIKEIQKQMIYSFSSLVESRDNETGGHVRRTGEYVTRLATELRDEGLFPATLTNRYIDDITLAAPLHDIGKMAIPDSILKKPDKLTPEEFDIMKSHTTEGGKILEDTIRHVEGESFFNIAKEVAVSHHEKWDGTGYPLGLRGDQIPVSARIMAVADFFDALTAERPYKKPYSVQKVYSMMEEMSGKAFDPRVFEAFVNIRPDIEKLVIQYGGKLYPDDDPEVSERDK